MPKNKVQEVIFTILMVFVMVYAMICYNIAVETGGMTNLVFLHAFRELLIMGPIAFLLDFFLVGGTAWTHGILGSNNLNSVAVFYLIINTLTA